jgi:hypothetical protein
MLARVYAPRDVKNCNRKYIRPWLHSERIDEQKRVRFPWESSCLQSTILLALNAMVEICLGRSGLDQPVTIITLPLSRGPLESGAIFLRMGMFSNFPWSGMGDTSCSLRAARRRFATRDIVQVSLLMRQLGQGEENGDRYTKKRRST